MVRRAGGVGGIVAGGNDGRQTETAGERFESKGDKSALLSRRRAETNKGHPRPFDCLSKLSKGLFRRKPESGRWKMLALRNVGSGKASLDSGSSPE